MVIKSELNIGVSIQANKLELPASYFARLQYHKAKCAIASITVTAAILALWSKHRMKHMSSRGPYLSSRSYQSSLLSLSQVLQQNWLSNLSSVFMLKRSKKEEEKKRNKYPHICNLHPYKHTHSRTYTLYCTCSHDPH